MIKTNGNKQRLKMGKRLLSLLVVMCMMLSFMPAMTFSVSAAAIPTIIGGNDYIPTTTDRVPGSLTVQLNDIGSIDRLNTYLPGNPTVSGYNYCTNPYFAVWIGNKQYTGYSTWLVSGQNNLSNMSKTITYEYINLEDGINYSGSGVPSEWNEAYDPDSTQIQKIKITWPIEYGGVSGGINIVWTVSYIRGGGTIQHEWRIENNTTNNITEKVMVYYGGHHPLGGGSRSGWSTFDAISSSIYTWKDNTSGVYMLRSDGSVKPESYFTKAVNSSIADNVKARNGLGGVPRTDQIAYDDVNSHHTCNYFQWATGDNEVIKPNESWTVLASEAAIPPSDLLLTAPEGQIVHTKGGTIVYEFTLRNLASSVNIVDLKLDISGLAGTSTDGWSVKFVDPADEQLTFNPNPDGRKVKVYVTAPSPDPETSIPLLKDGDSVRLTLTAEAKTDGETYTAFVDTTVDSTAKIITDVIATRITPNFVDIKVTYENLPGNNATIISIHTGDTNAIWLTGNTATMTSPLEGDRLLTDKIPTEGTIYNIPTHMLEVGKTYRVKAIVDGIPDEHFQYEFTMRGDEATGNVWKDDNGNGSMQSFEGMGNIDFTLEEDRDGNGNYEYTFEAKSTPVGEIAFSDKDIGTGNESHWHRAGGTYKFTPVLDPLNDVDKYAVYEIIMTADGTEYKTSIDSSANNPTFEHIIFSADGSVEYKFKNGVPTTPVSFSVRLADAAIIKVIPHVGSNKGNIITEDIPNLAVQYTIPNKPPASYDGTVLQTELPKLVNIVDGSSAKITLTAPLGYRLARTNGITDYLEWAKVDSFKRRGYIDAEFELIKRDVRLTAVEDISGSLGTVIENPTGDSTYVYDPELCKIILDTSWAETTADIMFNVYGSSAPTDRTLYNWTVVDSNGIFKNGITNTGANPGRVVFSGKEGTATVKIALKADSTLFHTMHITVGQSNFTPTSIYIASLADPSTPLTYIALLKGQETDIVVVGDDGTSTQILLTTDISIDIGIDPGKITITPKAGYSQVWTVKGTNTGGTTIRANYMNGAAMSDPVYVVVTTELFEKATGLKIDPDTINLLTNEHKDVKYIITFPNASDNVTVPSTFVDASLNLNTIAELSNDNSKVSYKDEGTDVLTAELIINPSLNDTANVTCTKGTTQIVPNGTLTLQEYSDPGYTQTYGFIEEGEEAEYFAFFDKNGNGICDGDETILPYETAGLVFSSRDGEFSTDEGTAPNNVLLEGLTSGVDELIVTYIYNGTPYTNSTGIVVYTSGYEYSRLEIEPAPTVVESGKYRDFTVYAVFKDELSVTEERHALPTTMYTGSIPSQYSAEASIRKDAQNKNIENSLLAKSGLTYAKEVEYVATLKDGLRNATADVLIIPQGALLKVEDPIWVKIYDDADVKYLIVSSNGTAVTYTPVNGLINYITASIADPSTAEFDNGGADFTKIIGLQVNRTTLSANFIGLSQKATATIYVFDDSNGSGIIWNNVNPVNVAAGQTGNSSVYLCDEYGVPTIVKVDLRHLTSITVQDENIAKITIPAAANATVATITGGNVTADSSTTVTAVSPAGTADLPVNVTTNIQVGGIKANPQIIELWPGETKSITITDTGTKKVLDNSQLNVIINSPNGITYDLANNNKAVVSGSTLVISQDTGVPSSTGSFNTMTIEYQGEETEVYIINYTFNPYENGDVRTLILTPDPVTMALGNNKFVDVTLEATDSKGTTNIIPLLTELLKWNSNINASTMKGKINIYKPSIGDYGISVYGVVAGAQMYTVTFDGGDMPLSANGSAFVFSQDETSIVNFYFEPEYVVLSTDLPYKTKGITAVIEYSTGGPQKVSGNDLIIAIAEPGLQSHDENVATISRNGIITSRDRISEPLVQTYVYGSLIGSSLPQAETIVYVYDANAELVIVPNTLEISTEGPYASAPVQENVTTHIKNKSGSSVPVPNEILTYSSLNGKITLTEDGVFDQTVKGISEGKDTIRSVLENSNKSATASVTILDGTIRYHTITYYYDETTSNPIGSPITVKDGDGYTIQSPNVAPPTDMKFKHWIDDFDNIYDPINNVNYIIYPNDDLNLYAIWEEAEGTETWIVTYDANGGSGTYPPIEVNDNQHTVLNNTNDTLFTYDGYRFVGWNDMDDGEGNYYVEGEQYPIYNNLPLFAIWEKEYSVIYHYENDGSGATETDTAYESELYSIRDDTTITKEGYILIGWTTEVSGTEPDSRYGFNQGIYVDNDLVLYPIWEEVVTEPEEYIITYHYENDGSGATETDTAYESTPYTLKDETSITKEGHELIGWTTEESGTEPMYEPGEAITPDDEMTLYPIWRPIPEGDTYTVTYNANGGQGQVIDTTRYAEGADVTVRGGNNLSRPGYTFGGWTLNSDGSGTIYQADDTYTMGRSDVTFYAVWDIIPEGDTYRVRYNANGGQGQVPVDERLYAEDETVVVRGGNNLSRPGYTFGGWTLNSDGSGTTYQAGDTYTMGRSDVTFYAVWDIIPEGDTYRVRYNANGGQGQVPVDERLYAEDETVTVRGGNNLSRPGYTFGGWTLNSDGSGTIYQADETYTMGDSDVTFYAVWNIIPEGDTYRVTYNANGGQGQVIDTTRYAEGADVTVRGKGNLSRPGYTFGGWALNSAGTGTIYQADETYAMGDSDVTFYAVWNIIPEGDTYRVRYNANGGQGQVPVDERLYAEDETVIVRGKGNLSRSGYTFGGWALNSAGTGTIYQADETYTMGDSDVTFYAVWNIIPEGDTYRVRYNANGGQGQVIDTTRYAEGADVTVRGGNNLSRPGYTFAGWNTEADGSGTTYQAGDTYTMSDSDVTFYAVWTKNVTPVVKYKLTVQTTTGGTVNSSVSGYYEEGARIDIIATANRNYKFVKWTTTVNGAVLNLNSANTTVVMPARDVVVTAQFNSTLSNISVIVGGGIGGTGVIVPDAGTGTGTVVADKYKVTYKANGGTGKDYVVDGFASGAKYIVLNVEPTGISYSTRTFTGWNTKADGSGKDYTPGENITITADLILYAQWKTKVELNKDDHAIFLRGYTDGTVRPDNQITRAEATSIFYRLLEDQRVVTGGKFSDVKNGEWYADAINYLASVGIATGYDDGTYAPDQYITRVEFIVMAVKFEDIIASSSNKSFSDVPATHWAYSYINSAVARGWISGYTDGTFRPENTITRAEVVKIVNAMLDRKVDSDALAKVSNPYSDIDKSHWAYAEIIEASTAHDYTRDDKGNEIWD